MRLKQRSILLVAMLVSTSSFAMSLTDYTLDLTFNNNSNDTLTFTRVADSNPGNVFTVTPNVIPPHSTAEISGVITKDFDLGGLLMFTDNQGVENGFFILDQRIFHAGQPEFEMSLNSHFTSDVTSMTKNQHPDARDLSISAATVNITNKG